MFDIGFLEIFVILIIALIVIGPERMPEVARKLGGFMGKTRNFINSVKSEGEVADTIKDFKQSMNLEEEKQKISNISEELNKGLSVGLEGVDLDSLNRPFGQTHDDSTPTPASQFNKAPSQPSMPQPGLETTKAPQPAAPKETNSVPSTASDNATTSASTDTQQTPKT